MLKVFVPEYDGPTKDNARLAKDVFPNSPQNLFLGAAASRTTLHAVIQDPSTTALLVMAHGSPACVFGQDNEEALTLADVDNNAAGLRRLKVFAWACKTALQLGPRFRPVAEATGAWWGYRTTVSAPSRRRLSAFRDVLGCIEAGFPGAKNQAAADAFLRELRDRCERHRTKVINIMAATGDLRDAHEIAVALRELWQHLDGFLPNVPQPITAGALESPVLADF